MKLYRFYILIFLACGLFTSTTSYSQKNNAEAALYNIGVGSVFSGIGAIINKKPEEKLGKVLLKGMAQGALGGYLVYESKILVGKIAEHKKLEYGWPAKFVNSAGISIIENAASNRNFWEQWNLNIGFNRIEFHTKDNISVKYRLMPVALIFTGYAAWGNKFLLKKSLQSGEFIFSVATSSYRDSPATFRGVTIGTAFVLRPDVLNNYKTITHEIIHIYQYHDFNVLNTYVNKPLAEYKSGSGFFRTMDKIFYYDFNYVPFTALYTLENFNKNIYNGEYYQNFFEHEAGYYSNRIE